MDNKNLPIIYNGNTCVVSTNGSYNRQLNQIMNQQVANGFYDQVLTNTTVEVHPYANRDGCGVRFVFSRTRAYKKNQK